MRIFLCAVVTSLAACQQLPASTGQSAQADHNTAGTAGPMLSLETDTCDDPSFDGIDYVSAHSPHFDLWYLPGTPAEKDLTAIEARLEAAYASIRADLGIVAEPTIAIYLSPNRVAATAHDLANGVAYPGWDRYEVIYTGMSESYEALRYGHELTHVLEYYADPAMHLPLLREGLAEVEDQSHRDLHEAYAQKLLGGEETRIHLASFEASDLEGRNYGRAGSLVQFLIDRYGMRGFQDFYRATAVAWDDDCWSWKSARWGCIDKPAGLTAMLDGALEETEGESWSDVAAAWADEVKGALETADLDVSADDQAEIQSLVHNMDRAIADQDPARYRSTLEGFYCDWGGESMRQAISARAIDAYTSTDSTVVSIIATGVKNFPTATVNVRRTDTRAPDSFVQLFVEKTPAGWRVTWGPDWY